VREFNSGYRSHLGSSEIQIQVFEQKVSKSTMSTFTQGSHWQTPLDLLNHPTTMPVYASLKIAAKQATKAAQESGNEKDIAAAIDADIKLAEHKEKLYSNGVTDEMLNMKLKKYMFKFNQGTPLCRYFKEGKCQRGTDCTFTHVIQTAEPSQASFEAPSSSRPEFNKTKWCNHFTKSQYCRLGADCNFAHSEDEKRCKYFVLGRCKHGSSCHDQHTEPVLQTQENIN
jgi:hypothetical protein